MLILNSNVFASGLEEYIASVHNQCAGVNQLIIKKSLIEITQDQNCTEVFTSLLLKQCPQVNCFKLLSFWASFNNTTSGSVIGK
jgi:hypothetical protein